MANRIEEYKSKLLDGAQSYTNDQVDEEAGDSENHIKHEDDSDDNVGLDELLDDIESDGLFLQQYREKRMQELSDHLKLIDANIKEHGYGKLQKLDDESELLKLSSQCTNLVVHFSLDKFNKCQYLNERLEVLAKKYLTTKFVQINVENCPFLVEKLKIKVLPFLVGYSEGNEILRLIGFAKLGNDPNGFAIERLDQMLQNKGIVSSHSNYTSIQNHNKKFINDDSDLDI